MYKIICISLILRRCIKNRHNVLFLSIPCNENRKLYKVAKIFPKEKDPEGKVNRKQLEVDFVCNLGSSRYYIQSAYSLPDETRRMQEIRPSRKIDDSFKKVVITKDIVQSYYDDYGILTVNIYDFLLDPRILER